MEHSERFAGSRLPGGGLGKWAAIERLEDRLLLSTVTWIGGAGAWSNPLNWSGSALPGANDTAVVNNGATVTVDQTVDVLDLIVTNGSVSDGAGQTIRVARDLEVSGTGNLASAGTLVFDGGGHSVLTLSAPASFQDVELAKTDNRMNLTVNGTMAIGGDLLVTGISTVYGGVLDVAGDVTTNDGSVSGSAQVLLDGMHQIYGSGELPVLNVAAGTTTVAGSIGVVSALVGGTLDASAGGIRVMADLTVLSGGSYAGDLTFDGGGHSVATIDPAATLAVGDVTLAKTDNRMYLTLHGTLPVAGDLIVAEVAAMYGDTMVVAGDVVTTDATVHGTMAILLNGTHAISGGGALPSVEIDGGTTTVTGDVDVQNLTIKSGTFVAPAGRLGITSDFTRTGGTFDPNGGTVAFDGGDHSEVTIGGTALNHLALEKTDYRMELKVNDSFLDVNGSLTITEISRIRGTVKVAGDVTTSDTTVAGGLIIMDGYKVHQNLSATAPGAQVPGLEIAKTDSRYDVNVSGTVDVNGDLTVTQVGGMNGGTINVLGNVRTTDNEVGGTGTVRLNGQHNITTDDDGGELPNLLIAGGTTDALSSSYLGVQDMTVTGGSFLAPAPGALGIAGNFTVSGGTFTAGLGTVTLNGGKTHQDVNIGGTKLNNLTIAKTDSRYNVNVSGTVDVNGDLTVTQVGGMNGTIKVAGDVITADTAVGGTGIVIMDGGNIDGPQALIATVAGAQVPHLKIAQWSYGRVNVGTDHEVTVNGDLTIVGNYQMNGGTVRVLGDVHTTDGDVSGTATILLNGSHAIDGGGDLPGLKIAGGTTTVTGDLGVRSLDVVGGTFVAPSSTLGVAGDWTVNGGTFVHNNGVVVFNNPNNTDITVDIGATALNDVTFATGNSYADVFVTGTLAVGGDLLIQTGAGVYGGTVAVSGDVTTTNAGFHGTGLIQIVGDGAQTLGAAGGTGQLPNVEVAKSGGTLTIEDAIQVRGDWTWTSGSVDAGTSLVKFVVSGAGNSITVDAAGMSFHDVTIDQDSWTSLVVASNLDVAGDLVIDSSAQGKVKMAHGGGDINVAGDVDLLGGQLYVDVQGQSGDDDLIAYGGTLTGTFSLTVLVNQPAPPKVVDYGDGSDSVISLTDPV
ncbi:MAG TPA: hypothetical protein VFJ30_15290 [Phycisphaerae bacterium]|nr:hypothetical protein [Phycisphaerae bacterium]